MKKIIITILILLFVGIVIICNYNNSKGSKSGNILTPISTIDLSVPEPSGLHYSERSNTLWTVSDENSTIYNINLEGKVLDSIVVDGFDLEGITIINDSIIVTILERDRNVIFLNMSGEELKRYKLDLSGEPNKGLEGIAFNSTNSHLFVINEKDPGTLLEIDTLGNLIKQNNLKFAPDYSGLCYDVINDELWIISDEGEAIFKCSPDGTVLEKFKFNIEQIEGITIDFKESKLYIVSDPLETLFVFNLP